MIASGCEIFSSMRNLSLHIFMQGPPVNSTGDHLMSRRIHDGTHRHGSAGMHACRRRQRAAWLACMLPSTDLTEHIYNRVAVWTPCIVYAPAAGRKASSLATHAHSSHLPEVAAIWINSISAGHDSISPQRASGAPSHASPLVNSPPAALAAEHMATRASRIFSRFMCSCR